MKKRALSVLLAMIMTLSFMPASAFAQSSAEQETTATTPPLLLSESLSVNNSETSGCVQIGSNTYDSLTAAVEAASAGDTLWLCDDDVTEQQVTIGKSLTIELQGHKLSSTALKITGSSTSVTINDRVGTGSINKNHADGFTTDHSRCTATIVVDDNATLTINGVTGTSSDTGTVVYDSATADLVKALFVQGASTLVINGGTFAAQEGNGRDALFVYDGTVTINDGYFLMNLSYNTAPSTDKPLTIKKCEIYNPNDSGAIWIEKSGTINGVSFNRGYQSLESIQKLFLSTEAGNYILSGSTQNHVKIGCGIYASSEISSTTLPDGTTYAVGSTNEDSPEQINPTTGSKITLAPQIAGGDGTTITYEWEKDGSTLSDANGATYTIDSYSSSDDGSYKVTATESGTSVSLYYKIGADAHTHCVCGGNITAGDHAEHTSATWTAWDGTSDISYANGVASVYLSDSAERSSVLTVKDGNTLNLCLNGKTLSRSYTVIAVEGNATLNICDCMGGGQVTSPSGYAISVTTQNNSNAHTTLNLYGGKVSSKSYSMLDPGAIKLYNNDANNAQTVAVFNMYGGEVCHEDLTESAVYASYANVGSGYYQINIYGGNITCEKGDGFDFNNNQNVAMQVAGGTITTGRFGIWLSSQNTLTLSGNPKFVDKAYYNGSAGIYIPAEVALTVAEDFAPAEGTTISVDKTISPATGDAVIARPATNGSSLSEKAQYFVSSEERYFVECNTDGNLQLTACAIAEQPAADNSYTVTASGGSTNKVAYQWYKATSGKVAVTDKNATKAENFLYYSSSYDDRWYPNYNPTSADQVTLEAFTLHMAKDDVLTVKYQDSDDDEDNSQGRFDKFTLIGNGREVVGTAGIESRYKTYAFVAPADGTYTLKATATPGTYVDSDSGSTYYNLWCDFSATVTADIAGDVLSGQTAAALNTAELENGKYICGVTWEGKTTLYSNAVEFSAPVHTHCVCGKTDCSGDGHDATTEWKKWESGNSLPAETGNYYLDSSVTLSDTWNISSDVSINLCLNGNTIYGASGKDVIKVNGGASLAITDCTTESTNVGKITHNEGAKGRGIDNGGTLALWNGKISGNTTDSQTDANGAGVRNYGTFTMHGGVISGNSTGSGMWSGGGVYNDYNAKFTMTGGSITGNTGFYSGGVTNRGIFDISGGSITENNTTQASNCGGGVWNGGTFNLSGNVNITGNTMSNGKVNNVFPYSTASINVNGNLDESARVGVYKEAIGTTVVTGSTNTNIFSSDNTDYQLENNGEDGLRLAAKAVTISGVSLLDKDGGTSLTDNTKVYDGVAVAYSEGSATGVDNVTLTYTWQKATTTDGTITYADLTTAPSDAGSYRLHVTAMKNNVTHGMADYGFIITRAVGSSTVKLDGWTYGSAANEPAPASDTNSTNNVTYRYKVKDADDNTYNTTVPTDAGDYTVEATFAETNNYNATVATTNFTIAKKSLTATITAENKTYDGNATATVSATLDGVIESDSGKVSAEVTNPAFENKTAAENKQVAANISLKGDAAGNYTVNDTAETTANITAKTLTINPLVIAEKYYDGTNKADFIGTPELVGVESGDEVTLVNGVPTFTSVFVGQDIPISFTDFTLEGADKDNYTLVQPTGITGDISAYIPCGLEYTTTTTDWTNQDFVVTAKSGWQVSETNTAEGAWSDSLTRSAETGSTGDSLTFYVKSMNYGFISEAITKTYKIDKTVPVISGAEDNKTYCAAVTLTITDDNLKSVSINGEAATPTESGTLTLEPAAGAQSVVATDKAGNSTTLTVTVNDGHTWGAWTSNGNNTHSRTCALDATHTETASCHGGKATCTDKAVCDDCKLVYGELDPNNHASLKHVEAKAATTTTEGNIEYWYCTGCDKYFASESGQDEITEPDTVIKKLPVITKGDSAKVAQGASEPLSFTSDADFADFLRVEVDGKTLDSKHYAVASGSTVVTLDANYVATLAAGEHVLGIVSQNGTATASFTVDKKAEEITPVPDKPTTNTNAKTSPQTGDSAALFVWLTLLFVSGSAATITALVGRKRKNN